MSDSAALRERFNAMDWEVLDSLKERFGARLKYIEQDGDSLGTKPEDLPPKVQE